MRNKNAPNRMVKAHNTDTPNADDGKEQQERSFIAGGNANCSATSENSLTISFKK
jgi:hypothetical protein